MNNYAIVDNDGNVVNICIWDGDTDTWQPPRATRAILVPDGEPAEPGGTYDGQHFARAIVTSGA